MRLPLNYSVRRSAIYVPDMEPREWWAYAHTHIYIAAIDLGAIISNSLHEIKYGRSGCGI